MTQGRPQCSWEDAPASGYTLSTPKKYPHPPRTFFVPKCRRNGSENIHVGLSHSKNATDSLKLLFSTGATGYIAGDALFAISKEHPDYEYSLLIRTKEKAEQVKKAYPSARIVLGDLDASDLLEEEAAKADIVLRMCRISRLISKETILT